MNHLLDMKLDGDFDEDEEIYTLKRDQLKGEIARLKQSRQANEDRAEEWLELTEQVFNFATYAHVRFLEGSSDEKRALLMKLGQNLTVLDGKLLLKAKPW